MINKNSLEVNQILGGFIVPLKERETTRFRAKVGFSHSYIRDSIFENNGYARGFQLGFGIEKFIRKSRIYSDFSYNYQKSNNSALKDFDMTKLSFGFTL